MGRPVVKYSEIRPQLTILLVRLEGWKKEVPAFVVLCMASFQFCPKSSFLFVLFGSSFPGCFVLFLNYRYGEGRRPSQVG